MDATNTCIGRQATTADLTPVWSCCWCCNFSPPKPVTANASRFFSASPTACRNLAFLAAAAKAGNDVDGSSSSSSSDRGEVPPLPPPGTAFTADGPVPFAGNILDSPDVVWMDDCWTKEEV